MVIFIDGQDLSRWCDHRHLEDLINCKAVFGRQERMAATSNVASKTDCLSAAANNYAAILIQRGVEIVHLGPRAGSNSITSDNSLGVVKLEGAFMVGYVFEMVSPEGERTGSYGASHVVMASVLDNEPDVVLPSYRLSVRSLVESQNTYQSRSQF